LLHGVDRGLNQQRVTRQHSHVIHDAFFADLDLQHDGALNSCLPCQFRINRLDLGYQIGSADAVANPDALRRRPGSSFPGASGANVVLGGVVEAVTGDGRLR